MPYGYPNIELRSPLAYAAPGLGAGLQTMGTMRAQGQQRQLQQQQLAQGQERIGLQERELGLREEQFAKKEEESKRKAEMLQQFNLKMQTATDPAEAAIAMMDYGIATEDYKILEQGAQAAALIALEKKSDKDFTKYSGLVESVLAKMQAEGKGSPLGEIVGKAYMGEDGKRYVDIQTAEGVKAVPVTGAPKMAADTTKPASIQLYEYILKLPENERQALMEFYGRSGLEKKKQLDFDDAVKVKAQLLMQGISSEDPEATELFDLLDQVISGKPKVSEVSKPGQKISNVQTEKTFTVPAGYQETGEFTKDGKPIVKDATGKAFVLEE